MAHKEQIQFCKYVKQQMMQKFSYVSVLDCGSLDINGNNRYLFDNCSYIGVDLVPGKNVDIISKVHELDLPNKSYDVVISTEMLEHDRFWKESLQKMYDLLKPGGLLIISCATTGRREHGTHNDRPKESPHTNDYYKNLTMFHLKQVFKNKMFDRFEYGLNASSKDLYFWGIKKNEICDICA